MKVKSNGRPRSFKVSADGEGLVSHAGSALVAEVADRVGMTKGLSEAIDARTQRKARHNRGKALLDIAVAIVDGADCLKDVDALHGQLGLFGEVASNSTLDRILSSLDEEDLDCIRKARRDARACAWAAGARPERVILDVDATPIESYSEKEKAAGHYKGGFGFNPLLVYLDETEEVLAGDLRPGNASPGKAEDHVKVLQDALAQLPQNALDGEILLRSDSAGLSHDFVRALAEAGIRYSIGMGLTEPIREAIRSAPEGSWSAAVTQEGGERQGAHVCELSIDLTRTAWPCGIRAICRRERPHPGAQLSFTDEDGWRFQVFVTDQDGEVEELERLHRAHARVEDRIRCAKQMGLGALPSHSFRKNKAWFELSLLAQDLVAWTKALALEGKARLYEPKRLRYRLLHIAACICETARQANLKFQATWPWAAELVAAFERLRALPAPA